MWRHITQYLARFAPNNDLLELGAGYCDFSNAVPAGTRTAMDLDEALRDSAAPGVRAEVGDCTDLSRFGASTFDVVFASNLLEHLVRADGVRLLQEARRVLRPGGHLILMQFRLRPHESRRSSRDFCRSP